jgi:hypothetical protein
MLAAGGFYNGTIARLKRIRDMQLSTFNQVTPPCRMPDRLRSWNLRRVRLSNHITTERSRAFLILTGSSLIAVANAATRYSLGRAWQGARLMQSITPAATRVAAGDR